MSRGGRGRGVKRDFPISEGTQTIKVAKRIFVNNLPFDCTWQELKDHFRSAGNVVYAEIIGGEKSKGCGIVEFETAEQAALAINTLHERSSIKGRPVYIREDREDKDLIDELQKTGPGDYKKRPRSNGRPGAQFTRGVGRGGPVVGSVEVGRRVYVNNLSYDTTWQMLKDHFKQAGNVVHAQILQNEKGTSKGCGIVEYATADEALRAISQMSNKELDGRNITVREDREDKHVPRAGGPARSPAGGRVQGEPSGFQIVVMGLPYRTTWQELKSLAGPNAVHAEIITANNGQSRGFGTVRFNSKEDAQQAVQALDTQLYMDRTLSVRLDKYA